eukprot:1157593-Pelagomonas_calceolata.AAC.5
MSAHLRLGACALRPVLHSCQAGHGLKDAHQLEALPFMLACWCDTSTHAHGYRECLLVFGCVCVRVRLCVTSGRWEAR